MSIKIGHASIDENGKAKGGAAGDQNGKEVCTRSWYSKPWDYILRPKTAALAEASARACEAGCANSKIGYDQNQRNTLNTQAKKVGYDLSKITTKCETDCSAFMTVCAIAGGANIAYTSNAPTTSTMKSAFTASGAYEVLNSSKYTTTDKNLKRGDILVKAGSHTVMALENGSAVATTTVTVAAPTLKEGASGEQAKLLQKNLNKVLGIKLEEDGKIGVLTIGALLYFQKKNGLDSDGSYGPKTYAKMKELLS